MQITDPQLKKELDAAEIFAYGSEELLKLESNMSRYFEREYKRWENNTKKAVEYGLDPSTGDISKPDTRHISVDHYDEEYRIYKAILDQDYMAYTMGYYGASNTHPPEKKTLEQAQADKYRLLLDRIDLKNGQSVLDLGCGFGGLSKYILKHYPDCTVTGVNPSRVQTRHIRENLMRDKSEFSVERYTLIEDYIDNIELPKQQFDRVFTVGLMEHVTNISRLQAVINNSLRNGGMCLHHCIVSLDTIPHFLNSEDTMMGEYYPGAHIWPFNEISDHDDDMEFVDSWFINGMNYWHTLDEWHRRFWGSLTDLYPENLSISDIGKWNKYFVLCKAMFHPNGGKSYGNGQYLFMKN